MKSPVSACTDQLLSPPVTFQSHSCAAASRAFCRDPLLQPLQPLASSSQTSCSRLAPGGRVLPALGIFLLPPILSGRVLQAVRTSWSTALDARSQSGLIPWRLQLKHGRGPVELVQSITSSSRFGGLSRCFVSFHSSPDVEQSIQIMVCLEKPRGLRSSWGRTGSTSALGTCWLSVGNLLVLSCPGNPPVCCFRCLPEC